MIFTSMWVCVQLCGHVKMYALLTLVSCHRTQLCNLYLQLCTYVYSYVDMLKFYALLTLVSCHRKQLCNFYCQIPPDVTLCMQCLKTALTQTGSVHGEVSSHDYVCSAFMPLSPMTQTIQVWPLLSVACSAEGGTNAHSPLKAQVKSRSKHAKG